MRDYYREAYTPKLSADNIRTLYQQAQRFHLPMTKLLNLIVSKALAELADVDDPAARQVFLPISPKNAPNIP